MTKASRALSWALRNRSSAWKPRRTATRIPWTISTIRAAITEKMIRLLMFCSLIWATPPIQKVTAIAAPSTMA